MQFNTDIFGQFHIRWALLCAGPAEDHNTMTISWGGMGTLWNKPVVTVYVKPCRYTYGFMEKNEYFTVSFYTREYRKALDIMGSRSGRDIDKDAAAGLTPKALGEATTYEEADVTLLCRKIYRQNMITESMPEKVFREYYAAEAPHCMYIGEVIEVIKNKKKSSGV